MNNNDLNFENIPQYEGSTLYGNYRTRTFANIFSSEEDFAEAWNSTPFAEAIEPLNISLIFYLLYARYGNNHIAASDENRFCYQLFSLVFQYGPTWNKELQIQKKIRELDIEDFRKGTLNITNLAANPSTTPSTIDTEELPYVNNQNVTKSTRSYADGYALMLSLLKEDVSESFLDRFRKLFITVVQPELPLWYASYSQED